MNVATKIEPETLLGALAKALPELEAAKKTAENAAFKQGGKVSKYADLGSVLEAIRPIAAHGLWFRQMSHENDHGVCVETFYIHASGELSAGKVFVPADRNNAQGFGSAQTYARRYGLQLAFGLATEDDDGNAAAANPPKKAANPAVITRDQVTQLIPLIKAAKLSEVKFAQSFEIERVVDLPASRFDEALERLKTRIGELVKAETNAAAMEEA